MSSSPTKAQSNSRQQQPYNVFFVAGLFFCIGTFCTIIILSFFQLDVLEHDAKITVLNRFEKFVDLNREIPSAIRQIEDSVISKMIMTEKELEVQWGNLRGDQLIEPASFGHNVSHVQSAPIPEAPLAMPHLPFEPVETDVLDTAHKPNCPHVDLVSYWQPPSPQDWRYQSPYERANSHEEDTKYITFEPDVGGWNNIRMQMEVCMVLALATGRTLVLPPDQPMYLLFAGKGHEKVHGFADYFPFEHWISKRLHTISMEEFLAKEAITGMLTTRRGLASWNESILMEIVGLKPQPPRKKDKGKPIKTPPPHIDRGLFEPIPTAKVLYPPLGNRTVYRGEDKVERNLMWEYLRRVGGTPDWNCNKEFVVIPKNPGYNVTDHSDKEAQDILARRKVFAGTRIPKYYDQGWQNQKVIHFISKPEFGYRILQQWYTFIFFEDLEMDKFYKRFVRDYVFYIDVIFCKAALIVDKLMKESEDGHFTTFHVRRGDLQYKDVKISSEEMLANVGHLIPEGQLLYIATDVKERGYFRAFRARFPKIRFLDDYFEIADLGDINPNFLGMIDQVVCTKGDLFVGTWFSTFSAYIVRMRGYLGYKDNTNYYADLAHRDRLQQPEVPKFPYYMREWNESWWNIDP